MSLTIITLNAQQDPSMFLDVELRGEQIGDTYMDIFHEAKPMNIRKTDIRHIYAHWNPPFRPRHPFARYACSMIYTEGPETVTEENPSRAVAAWHIKLKNKN